MPATAARSASGRYGPPRKMPRSPFMRQNSTPPRDRLGAALATAPHAIQTARMGFIAHWLVTGIALVAADWLLDGVRVRSGAALVLGALVLGLVNALVKPVLVVLTLPITVITLGFFYLVVNGLAFALAAALVPGFEVASLGSAMVAALIVGLVSWAIGSAVRRPRMA
jgi:putative membrane protein